MAIQWQIWTRTQITSFLVQCVSTNQITSVLCSYTLLYNPLVLNENLAFCFCSHQLLQGMCLQSSTSKMQLKFLFLYEASEPTRVFFLSLPSSPQHLITIYAFFFFTALLFNILPGALYERFLYSTIEHPVTDGFCLHMSLASILCTSFPLPIFLAILLSTLTVP